MGESQTETGKWGGNIEMKKSIYPAIIVLIFAFLVSGCSWLKSYGKLSSQYGPGEEVTIQELEENWEDYTISYAGYHGSFSIKHPSAIMFDPKKDNRDLIGDKWTLVENQRTLSKLISSIQAQERWGGYYPRLWRILGSDDQFYGYLFSGWYHVVMKMLDDRTMYVNDLPFPPYLAPVPGAGALINSTI